MGDAAVHLSLTGEEILTVHLKGKWQMETNVPSTETAMEQLERHPSIKRIGFNAMALGSWDSSLLIFVFDLIQVAQKGKIQIKNDGLPAGVRQLIDLATAVPKKEDAKQTVSRAGFFARVGSDVTDFAKGAGDLVAFVGVLQLSMFGAEVYVADLVGIAMVREMGAPKPFQGLDKTFFLFRMRLNSRIPSPTSMRIFSMGIRNGKKKIDKGSSNKYYHKVFSEFLLTKEGKGGEF